MISQGNVTFFVSDLEQSIAFYRDVLGMSLVMHAPGHFAMLQVEGLMLALHPASDKSPIGTVMLGLRPQQPIQDAAAALNSKGHTVGPIQQDGPMQLSSFSDPDGYKLYLAQEGKK